MEDVSKNLKGTQQRLTHTIAPPVHGTVLAPLPSPANNTLANNNRKTPFISNVHSTDTRMVPVPIVNLRTERANACAGLRFYTPQKRGYPGHSTNTFHGVLAQRERRRQETGTSFSDEQNGSFCSYFVQRGTKYKLLLEIQQKKHNNSTLKR